MHSIPSIPGKEEKFGYIVKESELEYPKLVSRPRFDGVNTDVPGPTDYDPQVKNHIKGALKFNPLRDDRRSSSSELYALVHDQEALKKHN